MWLLGLLLQFSLNLKNNLMIVMNAILNRREQPFKNGKHAETLGMKR